MAGKAGGEQARAVVPVPFTLMPADLTEEEREELALDITDALDLALAEQGAVRLFPPVQVTDPDELARLEAALPEAMQGSIAAWWYADGARGNRHQRRRLWRALQSRRRATVSSTDTATDRPNRSE